MSKMNEAKTDPVDALWEHLDGVRDVFLSCEGGGSHMQPMAPQADEERRCIWFFTSKQTDLARACVTPSQAKMCVVSEDRDFHACLSGNMVQNKDPVAIEEYWSPAVSAWFPKGKTDPDLTMLQFIPADAAVWASTDSALKFGWEILKANTTGSQPDIGYHTVVNL